MEGFTVVDEARFVDELAFLPIKGLKVCVTNVGRQCIRFPAGGFAPTFAGWRREGTPETRE